MADVNQPRYGVEIAMRVSPAHRRELLQTLEEMLAGVHSEGRASCELLEDSTIPNRFVWVDWWPTDAAAAGFLRSERFGTLMAAVRVLGSEETVRWVRATDVSASDYSRSQHREETP